MVPSQRHVTSEQRSPVRPTRAQNSLDHAERSSLLDRPFSFALSRRPGGRSGAVRDGGFEREVDRPPGMQPRRVEHRYR